MSLSRVCGSSASQRRHWRWCSYLWKNVQEADWRYASTSYFWEKCFVWSLMSKNVRNYSTISNWLNLEALFLILCMIDPIRMSSRRVQRFLSSTNVIPLSLDENEKIFMATMYLYCRSKRSSLTKHFDSKNVYTEREFKNDNQNRISEYSYGLIKYNWIK